jgi:hypothetical protein
MQNPAGRDVLTGEAIETRPVEPVPLASVQQGMPPDVVHLRSIERMFYVLAEVLN